MITDTMEKQVTTLRCYLGQLQTCNYLPGEISRVSYLDPDLDISTERYSALTRLGFRRSGKYVYRPCCPACQACQALRIPVRSFAPTRSQRRNWLRNRDVTVRHMPATFTEEHFRLYRCYQQERHPDSSMASSSRDEYMEFLACPGVTTEFIEFRCQGQLLAVSVIDQLDDGLSAVYTFFDPAQAGRGPGVFAVLWQISEACRRGLDWLYLGYRIRNCRKMSYKDNFRPCQILVDGNWQVLHPDK